MKKLLPNNKTLFWISKGIAFAIILLTSFTAAAQTAPAQQSKQPVKKVKWTEMSNNHNATFYDVQKDFNTKWKSQLKEMAREKLKVKKDKTEEKEAGGFEAYKRWESYMAPRVYPSGNMTLPSTNYANFMAW
jgi:basic membrane lipoprotein Med (substrate-binding protein (PBP1-ABC) superfamily)